MTRTERLPEYIHEAARRAIGGRPGPVLLSVPTDILDAEAEFTDDHFRPRAIAPRPAPRPRISNAALDLLLNAERPLIIAGGGVLRAGATDDLIAFAEATGIPVITAFRRYHAFPNRHPLYLGGDGPGRAADRRRAAPRGRRPAGARHPPGEFTTATYTVPTPRHEDRPHRHRPRHRRRQLPGRGRDRIRCAPGVARPERRPRRSATIARRAARQEAAVRRPRDL